MQASRGAVLEIQGGLGSCLRALISLIATVDLFLHQGRFAALFMCFQQHIAVGLSSCLHGFAWGFAVLFST